MRSMTGFASAEGVVAIEESGLETRWRWDAKSVNGKGLDIRMRTPTGWERAEPEWRALAQSRFARGSVTLALTLAEEKAERAARLDPAALARAAADLKAAADALAAAGLPPASPGPEALLAQRGVYEAESGSARTEAAQAALEAALKAGLADALDGLTAARGAEGAHLSTTLARQMEEIETLRARAETAAEARHGTQKARLREKVAGLLEAGAPIDEARLAQELAQIAVKTDVREELDRLSAHVAAARALFADPAPIGRKLDFLTQEFNREANTLCAKAQDPALTEIGLALKVLIDQVREQAANVE